MKKIEEIIQTIERLSILLGPPFEAPPPLMPIPGSAVPARSARSSLQPPASTEHLAPTTNKRVSGRKSSASSATLPLETKPVTWLDVGEDVMTSYEAKVDAALAERVCDVVGVADGRMCACEIWKQRSMISFGIARSWISRLLLRLAFQIICGRVRRRRRRRVRMRGMKCCLEML